MIIMGSVRSLADIMDEFGALTKTQQEYQDGNFLFFFLFTETWLQEQI